MSSLLFPDATASAQKSRKKTAWEKPAMFQGLLLGVDLYGIGNNVFGSDFWSTEASAQLSLWNRYMPVVEVGYGKTDTTDELNAVHFKTAAPYYRLGCDYNFMFKKMQLPGYAFGGLRVGFSSFDYDVDAPNLKDPNWGMEVPFSHQGISTTATWFELVGGLRANLGGRWWMSLAVRYKRSLSIKEFENAEPWYIPGYGNGSKSTNFGVTYSIIYKL